MCDKKRDRSIVTFIIIFLFLFVVVAFFGVLIPISMKHIEEKDDDLVS